jgi:hypothetical protein
MASQGKANHAERGEQVTATVRANDSLAGSLETVRSGGLRGVNASFDTATEGFEGVTHRKAYVASGVCQCRVSAAPRDAEGEAIAWLA